MAHTLLFADDSVTMQRVVELTFAQQGVDVISVSDGQQAIDFIRDKRPAMALVSVTLQKVNGFDVARYVRDQVEGRVPVILLAGAFDNLNETQVREAGASGVLVKPFEPAVVIKRVKELLGMNPEAPDAAPPTRPADTGSGRMFTTPDGPKREAPAAGTSGNGSDPHVEAASGTDYLAHLDAAFDSLDAQLAARSAPGNRTSAPAGAAVASSAAEPARPDVTSKTDDDRPAQSSAAPRPAAATEGTSKPVFEVDENWFNKPAAAAEGLGELTEFVVTRASDFAPAVQATSKDEDRSWLPGAAVGALDAPGAPGASSAPGESSAPSALGAPSPLSPLSPPSPPSAPSAPDAFAQLWQQAIPTPPATSSAPLELSAHAVDALTEQLTERVAARVGAPLADRLVNDLSARIISGLAGQLTGTVADRLSVELPEPLAASVSDRVGDRLAERLADRLTTSLAERLSGALGDRLVAELSTKLSADLAERVGAQVAERVLQSTLGDGLRQTVHDVAERVVRAEVDRIKAAAEAQRTR